MTLVNRFTLPGAVAAGDDVFVSGAGLFKKGVLDIPAADTSAVAAVSAIVTPMGATNLGSVDNTVVPAPSGGSNDPYPQYTSLSEAAGVAAGLAIVFGG